MNEEKRIDIESCPFSIRSLEAIRAGLFRFSKSYGEPIYLDELTKFTSEEVLNADRIGNFTLREIRKVLAAKNLCLKDDFVAGSEDEKKLIQDMPKQLKEMENILRDVQRRLNAISHDMEKLHANMQPIEKF